MKIALIGYGKMGKAIEDVALKNGHEIVLKITSKNTSDFNIEKLQQADVAIEFTNPHSAVENIKKCFDAGIPVVSGSTGWLEHWQEIENYCTEKNGALLFASNFSVGVNMFFELNKKLAMLMSNRPEYNISIEEIHHTQKKDAPSGTAITLAEGILKINQNKEKWVLGETANNGELSITSKRIDPAPGTHIINYNSLIDSIEIKHTAHNRIGFASGAVIAAEYIIDKKGIFEMKDVLSF
ncbi:MAG: 4-hydroxy-tetrahydrodipicolinate reductase [Bacteroidota bacterium]